MKRCMIYTCNHAWSPVNERLATVPIFECLRCGDVWQVDDCDHEPVIKGCECAR